MKSRINHLLSKCYFPFLHSCLSLTPKPRCLLPVLSYHCSLFSFFVFLCVSMTLMINIKDCSIVWQWFSKTISSNIFVLGTFKPWLIRQSETLNVPQRVPSASFLGSCSTKAVLYQTVSRIILKSALSLSIQRVFCWMCQDYIII